MTKERLYAYAQLMGACDKKGLDLIENSNSVADWIQLLLSPQGVEFCMENQFPAVSVLAEYKDELERQHVFMEGEHYVSNPRKVVVFGGAVTIDVNGFEVCSIYATNDAQVTVRVRDHAYVTVELHHNATHTKEITGLGKIKIYRK